MPRGMHGDDLLVEAGEAPFVLAGDLRLERAIAIAGHLDANRAIVGDDGLTGGGVALVGLDLPRFGGLSLVSERYGW